VLAVNQARQAQPSVTWRTKVATASTSRLPTSATGSREKGTSGAGMPAPARRAVAAGGSGHQLGVGGGNRQGVVGANRTWRKCSSSAAALCTAPLLPMQCYALHNVSDSSLLYPRTTPLGATPPTGKCCAVLCCAVLCCAVLCCAVLCGVATHH
jgi:hypothetical protein